MTNSTAAAHDVLSQISAALSAETPRATQFALQVESLSEDTTMARVRLCTGGTLDVSTALARTIIPMGHVESGDERCALVLAELDVSTDAGRVLRDIAYELCRLSTRLRVAQDQVRRARTPGFAPQSGQNDVPEVARVPTPFDLNFPAKLIKLSFSAIAGGGHEFTYVAPDNQYITFYRVLELGNCYFTACPYYNFWVRGQPAVIVFSVEAAHGTPLGQQYFGTVLLQIALAEFTT